MSFLLRLTGLMSKKPATTLDWGRQRWFEA